MKIALVDDDPDCLIKMAQICHDFGARRCCQIETFSFTSGEAFLNVLENNRFSVVFMDIYMKGTDGITTALKMRKHDSHCLLVFLTSSMDFMPDAFSCHAFEYIIKPFSPQRIADVLTDALDILPQQSKYIEISSDRKTIRIFLADIASVVTDAHYLNIELTDKTVLRSRMTMPEFIRRTREDARFIPVNKGIVLNADYILDFENNCCILENGSRFPVRIRDRLKIEQTVRDYHFEKIRNHQIPFSKIPFFS